MRKAFIIVPNMPREDAPTVLYSYAAWSGNPNNPGSWSTPEIGRWVAPPEGNWLAGVFAEKEAPLNDPNVAAWSSAGLYVIGLDQGNDYGVHRSELPAFVSWMSSHYHTAPVVEGWARSRGGMYVLNLLAEMPTLFDRVGGIAPITDGEAYDPYGIAISYTGIADPLTARKAFIATMRDRNAPNKRTAALAAARVPIMLAYGTADQVVLPEPNAKAFRSAYVAHGGTQMTLIPVDGADHELTKHFVPALRDFMLAPAGQKSVADIAGEAR